MALLVRFFCFLMQLSLFCLHSIQLSVFPSQSASLWGGKKLLPAPFVQLANWIETPGKISEIQRQRTEPNRAESQIRAEESREERGSNAGFTLLMMCNRATSYQPCCLYFLKATREESSSEAFYDSDLVSNAVICMWDMALEMNWYKFLMEDFQRFLIFCAHSFCRVSIQSFPENVVDIRVIVSLQELEW